MQYLVNLGGDGNYRKDDFCRMNSRNKMRKESSIQIFSWLCLTMPTSPSWHWLSALYKADVYSSADDEYFLKPDLETTGGLAEFLQKWGQTWWGEQSVNQLWFLSSPSRAHFTWGSWLPGNGENRRVQLTLSVNHLMIYIIPPHTTHHTTPHTTQSHRAISINPGKKLSCRQSGSISQYDRALFLTRQGQFHGYDCIVEIFKILQSTLAPHWLHSTLCLNLVKPSSHSSVFSNRVFNEVHLFW